MAPAVQLKVMDVADLAETVSINETGASAKVIMTAPLPASDTSESPYELKAKTLTKTLVPQGRLNGASRKVETLTVHCVSLIIVCEVVPSQSSNSRE